MRSPGTDYVIPACAGVWQVWWASWGQLGLVATTIASSLLALVTALGAVVLEILLGG